MGNVTVVPDGPITHLTAFDETAFFAALSCIGFHASNNDCSNMMHNFSNAISVAT